MADIVCCVKHIHFICSFFIDFLKAFQLVYQFPYIMCYNVLCDSVSLIRVRNALISIANLIVFYGCYLVKMLCQKKQGIQTNQIGKGKVGFVKFLEVTMKVAAIFVFAAGLVNIFLGQVIALSPFELWVR